jgi:predicted transcriptional regulator
MWGLTIAGIRYMINARTRVNARYGGEIMQVDVELLREKITEKKLTIEKLSNLIGIDASTFYRKIKANGETFTVKEMFAIIEILDISKKEAEKIFFAQTLA